VSQSVTIQYTQVLIVFFVSGDVVKSIMVATDNYPKGVLLGLVGTCYV